MVSPSPEGVALKPRPYSSCRAPSTVPTHGKPFKNAVHLLLTPHSLLLCAMSLSWTQELTSLLGANSLGNRRMLGQVVGASVLFFNKVTQAYIHT